MGALEKVSTLEQKLRRDREPSQQVPRGPAILPHRQRRNVKDVVRAIVSGVTACCMVAVSLGSSPLPAFPACTNVVPSAAWLQRAPAASECQQFC